MRIFARLLLSGILLAFAVHSAEDKQQAAPMSAEDGDYVVEQPGTITFRHGIVIFGKVEKPQVMIFLPKERSYYREMRFDRSFRDDLAEALPFDPIIE